MDFSENLIDFKDSEKVFIDWFLHHTASIKTVLFFYPILTNKRWGSLQIADQSRKLVPVILTPYEDVQQIVKTRMRQCIYQLQDSRYSRKKKKFVPIFGAITGTMTIASKQFEIRGLTDAVYILENYNGFKRAPFIFVGESERDGFLRRFLSQCYLFDKTFP